MSILDHQNPKKLTQNSKAIVNISRDTSSDTVRITIDDDASSGRVVEVVLTLEAYAVLITGMRTEATFSYLPSPDAADKYLKKRVIKHVQCNKINVDGSYVNYSNMKEHQRAAVLHDMKAKDYDGWELSDDGTTSQQPDVKHNYTIRKFVENDGEENE